MALANASALCREAMSRACAGISMGCFKWSSLRRNRHSDTPTQEYWGPQVPIAFSPICMENYRICVENTSGSSTLDPLSLKYQPCSPPYRRPTSAQGAVQKNDRHTIPMDTRIMVPMLNSTSDYFHSNP